jgi:nicotinamide riboside transporter PnuC
MMWLLTAASIMGVVLNNYRRRECFIIWIVANSSWMLYDWSIGAREQAVMFAVYLILSVWGFFQWGERKERRNTGENGLNREEDE